MPSTEQFIQMVRAIVHGRFPGILGCATARKKRNRSITSPANSTSRRIPEDSALGSRSSMIQMAGATIPGARAGSRSDRNLRNWRVRRRALLFRAEDPHVERGTSRLSVDQPGIAHWQYRAPRHRGQFHYRTMQCDGLPVIQQYHEPAGRA